MRVLILLLTAAAAIASAQQEGEAPRFEKDVLPIFTTYCFTCHGKSTPKLGLDVRTAASTLKGSHNGPVIVKGSLEKSLLWQKVSTHAMPPAVFGQKMPEAQIEIIRRWIAGGAPSDHPAGVARKEVAEQSARFDHQVLPLFRSRCAQCHGGAKPMAGLDLTSLGALLKGSVTGPVVLEGASDKSVLLRKVSSGNMPPAGTGKPLDESEIRTLREWIDKGNFADAVQADQPAERAFTQAEAPTITEKDRQFWSFRKPVAAPVPKVKAAARVRSPIDAFVLARLEAKGLEISPEAPKLALMRRAYMDVTGMPPSPEEIREFQADTRPEAYERLVDRLLASPRYGERWGRHWLDAAGYVDTRGKDFEPKTADLADGMWRYRDYVIRATNDDKPWDRFLTEQLAGDELVDWRSARKYTPEMLDLLVATGYLRNVLDITNEDITNLPVERYEALFKLMETVSSSTLGLTVACARCHTHKFDPIPQRDYYRFLALFTTAYNPTDWLQPKNRHLYEVAKPEQKEIEEHNAEIDKKVNELKKRLADLRSPYEKQLLTQKLKAVPDNIRAETRLAIETPKEKRSEVSNFLASKFGAMLKITTGEVDKVLNEADRSTVLSLNEQMQTWNGYRRKLDKVQALWDVGKPSEIRLLQRGSAESPGPKVDPGFLTVLCSSDRVNAERPAAAQGETSGRRLALAQWLTSRDHPLTARVIVNRMWQHHFGVGLVATPDNFGKTGAAPTHPELLDWLAVDFMDHGWKAKRLHRMILTSAVYRQSSRQPAEPRVEKARAADPENQLLWRMNLRRLDAEAIRDSVLSASGKVDVTMGGPPVMTTMRPDGLQQILETEPNGGKWRRSVYVVARRTYPLTFLGVFDSPVIDANCARRVPSATPLQSLTLMNDEFMLENAGFLVARAQRMGGENAPPAKTVEAIYTLALSRLPSAAEIRMAEEHIERQRQLYRTANVSAPDAATRALASLAQALLSSNEFLYSE